MELKSLITLLRQWLWVLLLGTMMGGGGAYLISYYQTPVYEASTQVMVIQARENSITSDLALLSDQELVKTYIALLVTEPVLEATSQLLGYTVHANQITAEQLSGTSLLAVTVEDNNPKHAADIANTLVEVLINQNELLQSSHFTASEESLQAQITQVEAQIASLQSNVNQGSEVDVAEQQRQEQILKDNIFALQKEAVRLELEIALLTQPNESGETPILDKQQFELLQEKKTQLAQLQFTIDLAQQNYLELVSENSQTEGNNPNPEQNQQESDLVLYQQIYANLLTNYETVRLARLQSTPNLVQAEPASISAKPIRPRPLLNTLLGSMAGLVLVGVVVFLKEYLDDTLKTSADIAQTLDLPVMGYIVSVANLSEAQKQPYVAEYPRSPTAEAFRNLRANLEFTSTDKPLKTLLITSAGPGEGKTMVATNLATAMSQGGKRVILVDCDLRRPRVHRAFGMSNEIGLSDFFRGQADTADIVRQRKGKMLAVVTSGNQPPNPAELLGSEKMSQFLSQLRELADIVIIDSPPLLVADAAVLAAKVDGTVLVIQPGHTRAEAAEAMLEQLYRAGARVLGVVLNRIPLKNRSYYGSYHYAYSPYYEENGKNGHGVENGEQNGRIYTNGHTNKLTHLFKATKE